MNKQELIEQKNDLTASLSEVNRQIRVLEIEEITNKTGIYIGCIIQFNDRYKNVFINDSEGNNVFIIDEITGCYPHYSLKGRKRKNNGDWGKITQYIFIGSSTTHEVIK